MKIRTLWKFFGLAFGVLFANMITAFFTLVLLATPGATDEPAFFTSVTIGVFLLAWVWFYRLCSKRGAESVSRSRLETRWERRLLWAGIVFCIGTLVLGFMVGYYEEDQAMRASTQSAMSDSIAQQEP